VITPHVSVTGCRAALHSLGLDLLKLPSSFPPVPSLLLNYQSMIDAHRIEADAAQELAIRQLDTLVTEIGEKRLRRKSNPLGWLFNRATSQPQLIKGLYLWGAVGRGKTMLMDMFFRYVPATRKRRVHFHDFMADVHGRIHTHRQQTRDARHSSDPIAHVAAELAEEAWVLCFDEFAVNDIADAMILARLFSALWLNGVIVVATSNVDPDELYKDGLNRTLFVPFIDLLRTNMNTLRLEARTDYRLEKLGGSPVYHVPADQHADAALDEAWRKLTGSSPLEPETLKVRGHALRVPASAPGVARFAFADLCGQPLGASDYIALAYTYHTVILDHVPVMELAQRNEAKRFITLIDIFYEYNVKMVISAAAEPHRLYRATEGREVFEFERTVSRLIEMRSVEYLAQRHGRVGATLGEGSGGIVET
jgi:cell division protein ZapE